MLTILKIIGWIVLPIVGHAFFWIGVINRVHGLRLRHRVVLDYGARLEGLSSDLLVARLLEHVPAQDRPLPSSLAAAKV